MLDLIRRSLLLLLLLPLLASCALPAASGANAINAEAIIATIEANWETQQVVLEQETDATPEPSTDLLPVNNPAQTATVNLQEALVGVYEQANPAVVYIIVPPIGAGTGFVYSEEGYIVTNNHVVAGGRSFEIVFAGGSRQEATLVGRDVDSDLAVLKVDELPAGVNPLLLAEGEALQVGQFVVAIGNPFGEEGSMSLGIISALGRSLTSQRNLGMGSSYSLPGAIQTDAPINPGSSGGPLLNLNGEVVGLAAAIATTTGANSGVGFAIPVQALQQIVPRLIAAGSYTYPYIGAGFDESISLSEQSTYGLAQTSGAYVLNVSAGSPAEAAGMLAANPATGRDGDLVVGIDGQPVTNFADLNSYLVFHTEPAQTIELTVIRGDEELVLPLTLAERP
jgi:S1-C subfamily serine protease